MTKSNGGEKILLSDGAREELRAGTDALDRANASQFFYTIRRHLPGESWAPVWKRNIPVSDVLNIEDFCYNSPDGGPQFEYIIHIVDSKGKSVVNEEGKKIPERVLPARVILPSSQSPAPGASAPPTGARPPGFFPADPILMEREQELYRRKRELELQRQETALERERKKFEKKIESGDNDDDDDDDGDGRDYRRAPMRYGGMPYGQMPYGMTPYGQPPYPGMGQPPWAQQKNQMDTLLSVLPAILQAIQPKHDPMQMFQLMIPLLSSGKFDPGEMFKMMGPMMTSMMTSITSVGAESQKIAMKSMADNDHLLKEKMIEMLEIGGADGDDIDRWRKILGLASDAIGGVVKTVFRARGASNGDKVEVPRIAGGGDPQRLPAPNPPAPRPAAPPVVTKSPEETAKEVVRQRVKLFVEAHEQEMHIGSDPGLTAEKFDEIYLSLPQSLRDRLEKSDVAGIYDALREIEPEVTDRILAAVVKDEAGAMKEWCRAFWDSVLHPDDGDEDGDDDGDGDSDDEPVVPTPDPAKA